MSKLDFSSLITPVSALEFFAQYWQQRPLLIESAQADRFLALVPAANVDSLLAMAEQLPHEAVELVGRTRPADLGSKRSGTVPEFFAQGSTIRVREVDKYWKVLRSLCSSIEHEVRSPTRANLYCTPEGTSGFDTHFDTHDVLVLQLLGKKRWQVYEPIGKLPLENLPALPFENDQNELRRSRGGREAGQDSLSSPELGDLTLNSSLGPGDCLYLPRGFAHRAESLDEPSVHLTIGIHALTWLDLFSVALGQSAYQIEAFREALPFDSSAVPEVRSDLEREFAKRMRLFSDEAQFDRAFDALIASFIRNRRVESEPAGSQLLDEETRLEGNGPLQVYVSADGTLAGLARGQNIFWMPASFAPAFRFVAEQQSFCPNELPGQISGSGKLNFLRRLVDDGFLRVAE